MKTYFKAACLALALLPAGPAPARAEGMAEVYRVGRTNIFCYMEPCPWRGISRLETGGQGLDRPLWWGDAPPPLQADAAEAEAIRAAWQAQQCLLVRGSFSGSILAVEEILGPCP